MPLGLNNSPPLEEKIIEMSENRLTKEEAQKLLSFLHLNEPKIPTFHERITELLDKYQG